MSASPYINILANFLKENVKPLQEPLRIVSA